MRLWIFSDLHLEMDRIYPDFPKFQDADVAVIAGDISNYHPIKSMEWISENIQMPTIFVAGNHEFYRGSLVEGIAEAREEALRYPSVHFLENDTVEINGVRFIGATLWTDFKIMNSEELSMIQARNAMNDYRMISYKKDPWRYLAPIDTAKLHAQSRSYIEAELDKKFDGPTVVVSHHCPHGLSTHGKYAGNILNPAFASDLSAVMENGRPDLWVHGHTHDSFDYVYDETRVICNPRGYGTENSSFDPRLVIEI